MLELESSPFTLESGIMTVEKMKRKIRNDLLTLVVGMVREQSEEVEDEEFK